MQRFTIAKNIKFLKDIAHCLCNFKRNWVKRWFYNHIFKIKFQIYTVAYIAKNNCVRDITILMAALSGNPHA